MVLMILFASICLHNAIYSAHNNLITTLTDTHISRQPSSYSSHSNSSTLPAVIRDLSAISSINSEQSDVLIPTTHRVTKPTTTKSKFYYYEDPYDYVKPEEKSPHSYPKLFCATCTCSTIISTFIFLIFH